MQQNFVDGMKAWKWWRPEPQFERYLQRLPNIKDWNGLWIPALRHHGVANPGVITHTRYPKLLDWVGEDMINGWPAKPAIPGGGGRPPVPAVAASAGYKGSPEYNEWSTGQAKMQADSFKASERLNTAETAVNDLRTAYAQIFLDTSVMVEKDKVLDNEMIIAVKDNDTTRIKKINELKGVIATELPAGDAKETQLLKDIEAAEKELFLLQMQAEPKYYEQTFYDPGFESWLKTSAPKLVFAWEGPATVALYAAVKSGTDIWYKYGGWTRSIKTKGVPDVIGGKKNDIIDSGMTAVFGQWTKWTPAREMAWLKTLRGVFDSEGLIYTVEKMTEFIKAVKDDPIWQKAIEDTRWAEVKRVKASRRSRGYGIVIAVAVFVAIIITAGAAASYQAGTSGVVSTIESAVTSVQSFIPDTVAAILPEALASPEIIALVSGGIEESAKKYISEGMNPDDAKKQAQLDISNDISNGITDAVKPRPAPAKLMSTPVIIGIAAVGLTAAGLIAYLILKKKG